MVEYKYCYLQVLYSEWAELATPPCSHCASRQTLRLITPSWQHSASPAPPVSLTISDHNLVESSSQQSLDYWSWSQASPRQPWSTPGCSVLARLVKTLSCQSRGRPSVLSPSLTPHTHPPQLRSNHLLASHGRKWLLHTELSDWLSRGGWWRGRLWLVGCSGRSWEADGDLCVIGGGMSEDKYER